MVHSQIGLFEAQLATIFKPHNSYCIFVDAKANKEIHTLVSKIINCYKSKYPQVSVNFVQKKVSFLRTFFSDQYIQSQKISSCLLGPYFDVIGRFEMFEFIA